MEGSSGSVSDSGRKISEDMEAFCEFLRNRQPPRLLSECTADDAVEFLRRLPSFRIEAVAGKLSIITFSGSHKENPFRSQIVRTFLTEFGKTEYSTKKEILFQMCLTTSDDLYLVIPNMVTDKYFPFASILGGIDCLVRVEDNGGKSWVFKYSYLYDRQSYALTKGWSSYVMENQLRPGDVVSFLRDLTDSSRLFISSRRRVKLPFSLEYLWSTVPDPTLQATSSERLILKEVETPPQLRLPKVKPILVVYCGDGQESEEAYFISYILNELCLRGFTPYKYDLTRSTVNANPGMLQRSRVCILIISMNNVRSRECLDGFLAVMGYLKANKVALIPVYFKVSGETSASARRGNSVQAFEVQKWRDAMIKLTVFNRYQYRKG